MIQRIRRAFSRKPEPFPDLPPITLNPIGVVRSKIREPNDWRDWGATTCRIVLRPEFTQALLGLDTYSHITVLFWPHQLPDDVRGSKLQLHPRDDPQYPLMGLLATRAQIRFNPVLKTVVALNGINGNILSVRGLDAIDGTPVLDIKPYIPHFDSVDAVEHECEFLDEFDAHNGSHARRVPCWG